MTRQVGNEIDEFVSDILRNRLVGLPLDLPALNIARGRDTGVAPLNVFRRHVYGLTGDSDLAPYASWMDFGFSMKHEASLINFMAAYGTHPTITADTTVAGKRAAAQAIWDVAMGESLVGPADSAEFLNSTGAWANSGTASITGLDSVDLWAGGLAEKQKVFGGMLGSTMNYVFEYQMESLQDGDRFYYLSRTAGLNLLTQLEGNSFSELIMRNTDVEGLPADSFSVPAFIFDLSKQTNPTGIVDDPATEVVEPTVLIRMPDGTIRYNGPEHVVFNGRDVTHGLASDADKVRSSEGDDTFRGNSGNDTFEGGDGNDQIVGGDGDDILTDLAGDETIKGGPGDDTISSGRGFGGDLNQGGTGDDFIIGGNDMTETFGGPGDDLVFAGDAEDAVFGDDGDDWIEGGRGPFALLQGDNGAPFQDDPNEPGHDVLFGYGGEQDYDSEGGDDIMFAGPGIQRAEGMLGFDWVTHRGDPVAGNSDMGLSALVVPTAVDVNKDRFDLVESLSGWDKNDILRGDDFTAADRVGHELTQAGIDRIANLDDLLALAPGGYAGGNIILGGGGSDIIEGGGGDDLIDGDRWLDAQLSTPLGIYDNLPPLRAFGLSGQLDPGTVDILRTIKTGAPNVDTALFSEAIENYTIERLGANVYRVTHDGGTATDGVDILVNVELGDFAGNIEAFGVLLNEDPTGEVTITGTPTEDQTLTATNTLADLDGLGAITYTWSMIVGPDEFVIHTGNTLALSDTHVGANIIVQAAYTDGVGVLQQVNSAAVGPVLNINDPVTGAPVLSDPAPTVGVPMSVSTTTIADEDGLPVSLGIQWLADGAPIPGATGVGFTPTGAQNGAVLTVRVSFTDLHGTAESVTLRPDGSGVPAAGARDLGQQRSPELRYPGNRQHPAAAGDHGHQHRWSTIGGDERDPRWRSARQLLRAQQLRRGGT